MLLLREVAQRARRPPDDRRADYRLAGKNVAGGAGSVANRFQTLLTVLRDLLVVLQEFLAVLRDLLAVLHLLAVLRDLLVVLQDLLAVLRVRRIRSIPPTQPDCRRRLWWRTSRRQRRHGTATKSDLVAIARTAARHAGWRGRGSGGCEWCCSRLPRRKIGANRR